MTATPADPPRDAVPFLVVADDGEPGWAVEVGRVQAVLATDDAHDSLDAARFGFPGSADRPMRVIRLHSHARDGGVAVRRQLAIVNVRRDDILALPPLLAHHLSPRAFDSVVFAEDRPPFLILDVDAVLGGSS